MEDVQDWLRRIERSEGVEEHSEEKGDEQNGESRGQSLQSFM